MRIVRKMIGSMIGSRWKSFLELVALGVMIGQMQRQAEGYFPSVFLPRIGFCIGF